MTLLTALLNALKAIVTLGASTNAACRDDIRNVVGILSDELDRALTLSDSYLVGARYSHDDAALANYLASVDNRLPHTFLEHNVCAGIYKLEDEFRQVFSPKKFTIKLQAFPEIPVLIGKLKEGERAVLDDLAEMRTALAELGGRLNEARTSRAKGKIKMEITDVIAKHRSAIASHKKQLKALRRRIVDRM